MKPDGSLDYLEFSVPDLAAVKQFYAGVFNWEFTDYGPNYTSFKDAGGRDGGFQTRTPAAANEALIILYANNLEDAQRRVVEAGGTICKESFAFPGGRRFHFLDPAGNQLAVWSDQEATDRAG